ncbi:hypothetical protein CFRA_01390 [Corynebacterium frankenforstense DSM 45800]|uniref:Esterase n=1 Tax=Corynebacterium frankenforstense DSM 45800 TaxID=1437875 RepID=A0A1L7CQM4_9CORY|nr:alpha/beta hydrolase family protein [Corynebacterium frankenforstense]APT88155.1 hypothetical protein CFRA_01390 [Corynebacterium frankenforstense DSM 45800]
MKVSRRIVAAVAAATLSFTTLGVHSAAADPAAEGAPVEGESTAAQATISTEKVSDEYLKSTGGVVPDWRARVKAYEDKYSDRVQELTAHSPSMDRDIPLVTVKAKSEGRPTFYLLNGAGGGDQQSHDWVLNTNVIDYFVQEDVNLVIPMAGKFSYYIDWVNEPGGSLKGPQKWETFLTKELPAPLESHFGANEKRAIAGMSMSATSSLLLAQHNPGFYQAVGSYSGCAETSTPMGNLFADITVNRSGNTAAQMWGPQGSETNRYQDALINAEKLRGTDLYISNGSGLIGERDTAGWLESKGMDPNKALAGSSTLLVEGGGIEGATNLCTHNLEAKLNSLDIPATYNFNNVGTHTWTYWFDDLQRSWTEVIKPSLEA